MRRTVLFAVPVAIAAGVLAPGCGRVVASREGGADAACADGGCPSSCADGAGTLCDGQCVDLASDHESCGRCGARCDSDAVCRHGACVASCQAPLVACGAHCADLEHDPHHCGSCANDCGAGHLCGGGTCVAYCPFAAPIALGPGNVGAAVGDVNGDGALDVVAVAQGTQSTTLRVYLGNGKGGFHALAAQPIAHGAGLALADVNGDHRPDALLLTGSGELSLSVYLNQGAGRFASAGSFRTGVWSSAFALADLNGDGATDVVITNSGGSQSDGSITGNDVTVLFGDGHGSFGRALHLKAGPHPAAVALADLDGDGATDIATTDVGDGVSGAGVNLFFGDGRGGFSAARTIALAAAGNLVAADLDGDGRVDLAVLSQGAVLVLHNEGGRRFADAVAYPVPFSSELAAGDVNGDGHIDLVVGGASVAVLFNRGDGTFELAASCDYPVAGSAYAASWLRIGDLDGNGRADLVSVDDGSQTAGQATVWWGQP